MIFDNIFNRLTGLQFFMSVLSPFLKIGLTVAVLAFSENLLLEISSFIISAEILTNLAEIPSGPFALLIFRDLIIWFMSLALAKGNSNSLSVENSLLIF